MGGGGGGGPGEKLIFVSVELLTAPERLINGFEGGGGGGGGGGGIGPGLDDEFDLFVSVELVTTSPIVIVLVLCLVCIGFIGFPRVEANKFANSFDIFTLPGFGVRFVVGAVFFMFLLPVNCSPILLANCDIKFVGITDVLDLFTSELVSKVSSLSTGFLLTGSTTFFEEFMGDGSVV